MHGGTDHPSETENESTGRSDQRGDFGCLEYVSRAGCAGRYESTYDSSSQDEDSNDEYDNHEDVVEASNGTIKISHGSLETESFSVDAEDGRLDLVPSGITVSVLVQYLERDLGSLEIREANCQYNSKGSGGLTYNRATSAMVK